MIRTKVILSFIFVFYSFICVKAQSPSPPIDITAVAEDGAALVFFNPPINFGTGASSIISYNLTSFGSKTTLSVTGTTSPIKIVKLTNGTSYSFTVTATNNLGFISSESLASNSVKPSSGIIDSIFTVSANSTFASSGSININSPVMSYGISSPGSTPSAATLNTGDFTFYPFSTYKFDISNASGTSGSNSGWDLINSSGKISFPTTDKITLDITAPFSGTTFNNSTSYSWTIAKGSSIEGFNPSNVTILTSNFQPLLAGAFSVMQKSNNINLLYTPNPFITVSTVNSFTNQCVNTRSSIDSFTVTGSYLSDNITITPPRGYQISQSPDSGFITGSILLSPINGTIIDTRIYVLFSPISAKSYSENNITLTSKNAKSQYVPVSFTRQQC